MILGPSQIRNKKLTSCFAKSEGFAIISKMQFNKDLSPVSVAATVRVVIFSSTKYKEKAQMELILHRESHCSVAIYLQRIYCKIDIMMEMMMRTR